MEIPSQANLENGLIAFAFLTVMIGQRDIHSEVSPLAQLGERMSDSLYVDCA